MTSHWVVLAGLLALGSGQQFNNGFINPLFLPRTPQSRGGRLYDPWTADLRDNGYYLSRGGALRVDDVYRDRGLPYDSRFDERRIPSRYDDIRRYPNRYNDFQRNPNRYNDFQRNPSRYNDFQRNPSRFDDFRSYPNRYDDFQRNPSSFDDPRRYLNRFDDNRRLPVDSDIRYNDVYRQYPEDDRFLQVGLATTARPEDRVQLLDRAQGVGRGQILSTASPDLSVTVQPNGSA